MPFDFGLGFGDQSEKGSFNQTTTPLIPDWLEGPYKDLIGAVSSLGYTDHNARVPGPTGNQQSSFNFAAGLADRYGVSAPTQPTSASLAPAPSTTGSSAGGLFGSLGVSATPTPDYAGYVTSHPDLNSAFQNKGGKDDRWGDTIEEWGKHHWNAYGQTENRSLPTIAAPQPVQPSTTTGGAAPSQPGHTPSATEPIVLSGPNPLDNYADAGDAARGLIGQRNQIDGAETGESATVVAPQIGSFSFVDAPGTIDVSSVASQSVLDGLGDYMSPYTQDVIDTTLDGFDDNAGRQQAAYAAKGAASGAFGGSRFAVGEAQLTSDLARERAAMEASLRDEGFRFGAGLSSTDADRRQAAGTINAQAENSAAEEAAARDMNAQALNQNASLSAATSQLGVDANVALDNAARSDAISMFNAGEINEVKALNLSAAEAGATRDLTAAGLLGDIGSQQTQDELATMAMLAEVGGIERAIQQAQANGDIDMLTQLMALYQGYPINTFTGADTSGNSSGSTSGFNFEFGGGNK